MTADPTTAPLATGAEDIMALCDYAERAAEEIETERDWAGSPLERLDEEGKLLNRRLLARIRKSIEQASAPAQVGETFEEEINAIAVKTLTQVAEAVSNPEVMAHINWGYSESYQRGYNEGYDDGFAAVVGEEAKQAIGRMLEFAQQQRKALLERVVTAKIDRAEGDVTTDQIVAWGHEMERMFAGGMPHFDADLETLTSLLGTGEGEGGD